MKRYITIRFVSHPGLFTLLCRFAQYGFWATHCEVVLPDGRRISSWFLKGGVRIEPADYDVGAFSREMYIRVEVTEEEEKLFYSFLMNQLEKPYDWRAIVSFYSKMSGRNWQEDDSWFCSEYVGSALAVIKKLRQHMAIQFSRVTVRDLVLLTSSITDEAG